MRARGYVILNLDCIVFAQQPKLSPFKQAICERIAEVLTLLPEQVSVKAKTGEGIGPVGRQEIIQAQCVALLNHRA